MPKIFDIIKYKDRYCLVVAKQQIGHNKILLKTLLISNNIDHITHEDWLISNNQLQQEVFDNHVYVQFWNDPIFVVVPSKFQIITSLSDEGKIQLLRTYQEYANNLPIDLTQPAILDKQAKLCYHHQINEKIVACKLSLPAKKTMYQMSDEKNWKRYEKEYLKALQKTLKQIQSQI